MSQTPFTREDWETVRGLLCRLGDDIRTAVIAVPPDVPRAEQSRIRLRLRGWSWRLVDIEVTEVLRGQMAQRLTRTVGRLRAGDRAPATPP